MEAGAGSGARCAVLARALEEPLAGTAPVAARWACLEHRGAWPADVAEHPAVVAFAARAAAADMRLVLIRRPGRRPADSPLHVLLADTAPQATAVTSLVVTGPSELADVPLPGPGTPLPGTRTADALLLVCTHGRRDRCCALDGRALATALTAAAEPHVWECSHLGGHRFAPTALVLPTGYLYGRLDVESAGAARKAAGAGEVETALCRGRSTWSAEGQVAELAVRAATGMRDAGALVVHPGAGPTVIVQARGGTRWAVDIERREIGSTRPGSCGGDPAPIARLSAAGLRALP